MKHNNQLRKEIEKLLGQNSIIKNDELKKLQKEYKIETDELLISFLPYAAEFAKVPISKYKVGAVVLGKSGNIYFGSNMEFEAGALSATVHAEQSAVNNAWLNGETGINKIAVTAAPCGYCRQFLNELTTAKQLHVLLKDKNLEAAKVFKLTELLPEAFGPRDLEIEGGLMKVENHKLKIENINDELINAALEAANKSYAPYSKNYSGVSIQLSDGTIFSGRYSENAAYNPSLLPFQSALAFMNMNTKKGSNNKIVDAVLVEAVSNISQKDAAGTLLNSISKTKLRYYKIKN
ncbi:MAG: cytidine deaminase [Ignavibacteria bacterium GWB2_35_6b]|nr:MAG: cytidine deaminase [Ignavibacteria bacterium GWB2_35_6b]